MFWHIFIERRISALFVYAYVLFFSVHRYDKKRRMGILLVSYLLLSMLDWWDIVVMKRQTNSLPVMLAAIILVQATVQLLAECRGFRALFTGVIAATYVLVGNYLGTIVYDCTESFVYASAVQIIVNGLILALLLSMPRKEYLGEPGNDAKEWVVLCLIPSLFFCIVVSRIACPGEFTQDVTEEMDIILILILMIAVYVIIGFWFYRRRRETELEHDIEFLERHTKSLKDELQLSQEKDTKMAIIRHDLRHYLHLMSIYLESDEIEKLQEMLMIFSTELEQAAPRRFCENIAVNGIVSRWEKQAQEEQVSFECRLDVPKNLGEDTFEIEFAAVVSNLLENAVRAAAGAGAERFVSVHIAQSSGRLILEVVNSFSDVYQTDQAGKPLTSGKGEKHGYGLRSVAAFAKKRDGIFDYSAEDSRFTARLLVQLPHDCEYTRSE